VAALAAAGWHTITVGQLGVDLAKGIRPAPKTVVFTFDDGWGDGYDYAFPSLARHGFVGTFFVITDRIGRPEILSPSQLQALTAAGDEIGDHTVAHLPLGRLTSPSARVQVIRAAQQIAEWTGRWPTSFAYPYGSLGSVGASAVSDCKTMLTAVTEVHGASETWATRFELPRIKVFPSTKPAALLAAVAPFK
jgi:peptidoglycan/xylan/chitin deacetylase (PgdA/CDA1 family)